MTENDKSDLFLQELKEIASGNGNNFKEEEPPTKKARTGPLEEVITRAPQPSIQIQPEPDYDIQMPFITREIMSEKHTLAPQIPIVSEVPLPAGYNPRRLVSEGISAGRPLIQLPDRVNNVRALNNQSSSSESKIARLARENPATFVPPPQYHLKKAGVEWNDPTLAEWNPNDFRIFVGNLGPEVNNETLRQAFGKYGSFLKAKVIRDKRLEKSKGYGFASFADPNDYLKVMKEMQGQYIGNRPVMLRKSKWKDRLDTEKISEEQNVIAEANKLAKAKAKKSRKVN